MFPKPMRLPSIHVGIVIRQGKRVSQSGCELRMLPSENPVSRFAVVIPLSTHKRAVKRNLLKRRIRESVRHIAHLIKKPNDFIVFGRKELLENTQQEIEVLIAGLFRKIDL